MPHGGSYFLILPVRISVLRHGVLSSTTRVARRVQQHAALPLRMNPSAPTPVQEFSYLPNWTEQMHKVTLEEAKKRLDELINQAANGEEVIITRGDGATFQIIPTPTRKPRPVFGSGRGLLKIADDFDEPLEDFEPYMR